MKLITFLLNAKTILKCSCVHACEDGGGLGGGGGAGGGGGGRKGD